MCACICYRRSLNLCSLRAAIRAPGRGSGAYSEQSILNFDQIYKAHAIVDVDRWDRVKHLINIVMKCEGSL